MPEVIVVAGGCRGVGASFIAGVASLAACRQQRTVLLIDGVAADGTQDVMFAGPARVNLWDLADRRVQTADVAIPVDHRLTIIPGASPSTTPYPLQDAARRTLLRQIADAYGHVDLIIVDAGSRLDAVRVATEALDGELLVVTSGDRIAMATAHAMVKALHMTRPQSRISIVANRDTRGRETCEQLNAAASRFLGTPLVVAGSVPDDRSVHAALRAGFTLIDAAEDSIATLAVTGVLAARATSRDHLTISANTTAPFLALSRSRS